MEKITLNLCLVWLFLITFSDAQEFFFNGFMSEGKNLTLNNAAHIERNGLLRLTNSTSSLVGHALYSFPLKLKSSPSSPALSFSAILDQFKNLNSNGLAFSTATKKCMDRALPDQYSLLLNSIHDDNASNFNDRGFSAYFCPRSYSCAGDVYHVDDVKLSNSSMKVMFAWIESDSGKTLIDVGSSSSYEKLKRSDLSFESDLASSHYILGWSSNVSGSQAPFNTDLSQLLASLPKGAKSKGSGLAFCLEKKRRPDIQIKIVVISASVVISLLLLSIWLYIQKMKTKQASQEDGVCDIIDVETLHMKYNIIRAATENFTNDRKLGQGGFGHVYKGTLEDGQEVAVKRLSENSGQGIAEFMTEVRLVAKLQHRIVVKLLGYCIHEKERILVYEFLPNSSLDKFLFDETKRMSLNWETRFKIIYEVSKGLLYLHEDSRLKIIHRDLKWSNILLDEAMNPKISDFGLAKLFDIDQTQDATNTIVGTCGYMAPEYRSTGHYSIKSDVYSFGVMILELVSGQRNYMNRPFYGEALLHRAWRSWNQSTPLDLVDKMLGETYSREEVTICVHMGLLCIQEEPTMRPNMIAIVDALRGQASALPWPSSPSFFGNTDSTSVAAGEISICETANITELYPR